ncbi:MAG: RIP metalloprotease RseP [Betaproteobacteria bacterium]|nr:RIP metalloprotease RseP [Betaproteobacteria bacterium]
MGSFLYTLAAFAIVLGVLIVVHEYGHYLVARWAGVKVLRFSVGFGRVVWSRRVGRDGTEWALGIVPLGGYVKMLDEGEGGVAPEDVARAFNRQSVYRRMAIVAAGPSANFLLAILVYWGVFWHGTAELKPILGTPVAASAAARAGVENGELVLKVAGEDVHTWQEMRWELLRRAVDQESVSLEVINARSEIALRRIDLSSVRESGWEADSLEKVGVRFFRPDIKPVIGKVTPDSAAAIAGLRAGDEIRSVGGAVIESWGSFVEAVRESPGKALALEVVRDGQRLPLQITPASVSDQGRAIGRIGAAVAGGGTPRSELVTLVRYGPVTALGKAVRETWEKSVFSVAMIGKILTGEVSWRNLSGPVTIADYAGQSAKLGFDYYLKFLALVSISLGVLNLLPIPILDGGHLLYYTAEIIKRAPLSERTMEIGQRIGMALLLILMVFAFYNDINRLLSG